MNTSLKNPLRITTVIGARPQFVKAAVVSRAIQKYNQITANLKIEESIIHTGQHFDYGMSEVFFETLNIPRPMVNLCINSYDHGEMTGRMMIALEKVLKEQKPDWVLVYGDTNSTLAGAITAAKLHIPIAHVEAGLRSYNKRMPEEINRTLTDHVADLLLCPTPTAVNNLAAEGIIRNVFWVGDVMYDSLLHYLRIAEKQSDILNRLGIQPGKYFLCTVHRAENTNDLQNIKSIVKALECISRDGWIVVLPVHPRTKKIIEHVSTESNLIRWIDPVDYLEMIVLEKHARAILTDSGGVQKEAYWLRVPCITLRNETEWIETVSSGWNSLPGADTDKIVSAVENLSIGNTEEQFYGDGKAAEKILNLLTSQEVSVP